MLPARHLAAAAGIATSEAFRVTQKFAASHCELGVADTRGKILYVGLALKKLERTQINRNGCNLASTILHLARSLPSSLSVRQSF